MFCSVESGGKVVVTLPADVSGGKVYRVYYKNADFAFIESGMKGKTRDGDARRLRLQVLPQVLNITLP